MQLDKERKISSAYADELRRTKEQNLAVVRSKQRGQLPSRDTRLLSPAADCAAHSTWTALHITS